MSNGSLAGSVKEVEKTDLSRMEFTKNLVTQNELSSTLDTKTTPVHEAGTTTKRNFSVIHNRLMKNGRTTVKNDATF